MDHRVRLFVLYFVATGNGAQAAIRAGWSEGSAYATSHALLARPEVQEMLEEARRAMIARTEIGVEQVLREIAAIAFSDVLDVVTIDRKGRITVDASRMTPGTSRAVSEISQEAMPGRVLKTRIKFHSKLDALDKLCRCLGIYADPVNPSARSPGAMPLGDDLQARREAFLRMIEERAGRVVDVTPATEVGED